MKTLTWQKIRCQPQTKINNISANDWNCKTSCHRKQLVCVFSEHKIIDVEVVKAWQDINTARCLLSQHLVSFRWWWYHENNVEEKVYHLYSYEATMRMCGGNPSIGVWNQKQTLFPVFGDQVTRALSSLSWHHAASLTTLTGARASVWHLHNFSAVPILFTGNYSTGHQLVVWKTRKFHILVKLSRC